MDITEEKKFKKIIEDGYEEIIEKRVSNPYSHLIYYLLDKVD